MIMHRPHRVGLIESMQEAREFKSLKECLDTLVLEFNERNSEIFTITTNDICIQQYYSDERVCWHDMFIICILPYSIVKDKDGYERFFNGKYEHTLQLLGFFTTDYEAVTKND